MVLPSPILHHVTLAEAAELTKSLLISILLQYPHQVISHYSGLLNKPTLVKTSHYGRTNLAAAHHPPHKFPHQPCTNWHQLRAKQTGSYRASDRTSPIIHQVKVE